MATLLKTSEEVVAEIIARLETRTVALGAETDLGVKVYEGRVHVDDRMIPCCALIEGQEDPSNDRVYDTIRTEQDFAAVAYLPCDPDRPNVAARAGVRDIKRALFSGSGRERITFGGKVAEVKYRGREIAPRADGAAFVVALVHFSVTFTEVLSNP